MSQKLHLAGCTIIVGAGRGGAGVCNLTWAYGRTYQVLVLMRAAATWAGLFSRWHFSKTEVYWLDAWWSDQWARRGSLATRVTVTRVTAHECARDLRDLVGICGDRMIVIRPKKQPFTEYGRTH